MGRRQKPLLTRPAGASEIFSIGNDHHGTLSSVICELCGTKHPKRHPGDHSYSLFTLLGRQGVLECCGALIDQVYREWGDEFTERVLGEFGEQPLDNRFSFLRRAIGGAVREWQKLAEARKNQANAVAAATPVE
ncbi:MAG: hypothetical protein HY473_02310 [Candidatus Sungbacteria bacterium]|uniref:Uncharacterized protein n=1 Tax=Candidatus Sungiibacteriota bacterium TaxID=2750080 RepID=A0A932YZ76_9BACT|nr:hypothetical protein [Candidatus Sungbacteria bacterium]